MKSQISHALVVLARQKLHSYKQIRKGIALHIDIFIILLGNSEKRTISEIGLSFGFIELLTVTADIDGRWLPDKAISVAIYENLCSTANILNIVPNTYIYVLCATHQCYIVLLSRDTYSNQFLNLI